MRIFVLCTGRCGSKTFAKACEHVTNYTAAHESGRWNRYSLEYPENHIEVDNRLAWFLGRLDNRYPGAFYVHLLRDEEATTRSYALRAKMPTQIVHGFMFAIKQGQHGDPARESREMVATINANIRHFLREKPHMTIDIETADKSFPAFWERIRAEGRLDAALGELKKRHNQSPRRKKEREKALRNSDARRFTPD